MFRILSVFIIALLVIFIAGCGDEAGEIDGVFQEEATVNFSHATPPAGPIDAGGKITLTFDGEPRDVKSNIGTVRVDGETVNISGPFLPGPAEITVTWAGGSVQLEYVFTAPCAGEGNTDCDW